MGKPLCNPYKKNLQKCLHSLFLKLCTCSTSLWPEMMAFVSQNHQAVKSASVPRAPLCGSVLKIRVQNWDSFLILNFDEFKALTENCTSEVLYICLWCNQILWSSIFLAADNVYSVVSDKWPSYITLSVWTCNLSSPYPSPLDPGTFFYSVGDTIKNRG